MSVGDALRAALGDYYQQSWRLFLLTLLLLFFVLAVALASLWFVPALVLLAFVGPLAAALMHAAVTLAQTEDVRLRDALTGLRLHWRRGLWLGLAVLLVVVAGIVAIRFYAAQGQLAWSLSIFVLYLLLLFGLLQLALWPRAVLEHERPLRGLARDAALDLLRRPAGFAGLGAVLLALNAVAVAAALRGLVGQALAAAPFLVPVLSLTVGYSFLAAAHFALPPGELRRPLDS